MPKGTKPIKTKKTKNGCTETTNHTSNAQGYPHKVINGKLQKLAKVALEKKIGRKLTKDELTFHKCNNHSCINPAHLKVGTKKTNNQYTADSGRRPKKYKKK